VAKLVNLKKELTDHLAANGEEMTATGQKLLKTPCVCFAIHNKQSCKKMIAFRVHVITTQVR
jgi:hypothetical protein